MSLYRLCLQMGWLFFLHVGVLRVPACEQEGFTGVNQFAEFLKYFYDGGCCCARALSANASATL